MKREPGRKLNQAQHIWLAIMTELAIERMKRRNAANLILLHQLWVKHARAGKLSVIMS